MDGLNPGSPGWKKSKRCESAACVEVLITNDAVGIRNSNLPTQQLVFEPAAWRAFLADVREESFGA